jgi:hypothetical protein
MLLAQAEWSDKWYKYTYVLTYKASWEDCKYFAYGIVKDDDFSKFMINVSKQEDELCKPLTSGLRTNYKQDIFDCKNGHAIEIQGLSKKINDLPISFMFYNDSNICHLFVPSDYVNNIKKSETELLSEDERIHTFDRYMDEIEILMIRTRDYDKATEIIKTIIQELVSPENFKEDRVICTLNNQINLSNICRDIVKVHSQLQAPKTGGEEAVINTLKVLNKKE